MPARRHWLHWQILMAPAPGSISRAHSHAASSRRARYRHWQPRRSAAISADLPPSASRSDRAVIRSGTAQHRHRSCCGAITRQLLPLDRRWPLLL